MRGHISQLASGALVALLFGVIVGCGGRQDQETTAQTQPEPEPPPPTDYRGRTAHSLQADGIDLEQMTCNLDTVWAHGLRTDAESFFNDLEASITPYLRRLRAADREMLSEQITMMTMNWFIRVLIIHGNYNNLGAVVLPEITWTDEAGQAHPLIIFHSGTTPFAEEQDSCFRSLLSQGRVRHVINLYDGNAPIRDQIDSETRVAQEVGASYLDVSQHESYRGWRDTASDEEATDEARTQAAQRVATLIREQIITPDGSPPQGNIYFHCAGGMHRSPLIASVLRRCVANESMEQVEEAMRIHGAAEEGDDAGFEPPILEFVRDFDCALLEGGGATAGAEAEGEDAAGESEGEGD